MIKRLEINGASSEVDERLRKYVVKKIGRLDKYLPRNSRESVHAEVKLREDNARGKKERICEVILHLPQEVVAIKESTISLYAAVDIVETKLRQRLTKYKELHTDGRLHQRLLRRLKHRIDTI